MKRGILGQVALSLLLVGALAWGQTPEGKGQRFGPRGPNSGTPPDPQQMIQHLIDRLANRLNLTDAQKTQTTTIAGDALQAALPVLQQLRSTTKSIQDAVKANNTAQIDQLATTVGTLTAQLTAIGGKAEAQFFAILTPDQQAQIPNLPLGPFGLFGGGHGGFRGPGGPGPQRHGGPPPSNQ